MSTKAPQGTAAALLEVAARNLGFVEGPKNNENPYAPVAGHANFQPWCASFVVACCRRAGVKIPNESAYTPTMANGFKQQKRYDKTPKVGSIVFFFWPNMGRIAHVGIVESVEPDGSIRTIEGNTNGGGSRTGGMVVRLVRKANIDGFGHPEFVDAPTVTTITKPTKTSKPVVVQKKINPYAKPVLTKSRPDLRASGRKTKAEVQYVQWAVGAKADGAWGAQTTKAVKAFQTKNGLTADGQVGPKSLAKMEQVRR